MSLLREITHSHLDLDMRLLLLRQAMLRHDDPALAEMAEALHEQFRDLRSREKALAAGADRVLGPDLEEFVTLSTIAGRVHAALDELAAALEPDASDAAQLERLMASLLEHYEDYAECERAIFARYGTLLAPSGSAAS